MQYTLLCEVFCKLRWEVSDAVSIQTWSKWCSFLWGNMTRISVECPKDNNLQWTFRQQVYDADFVSLTRPYSKSYDDNLNDQCVLSDQQSVASWGNSETLEYLVKQILITKSQSLEDI